MRCKYCLFMVKYKSKLYYGNEESTTSYLADTWFNCLKSGNFSLEEAKNEIIKRDNLSPDDILEISIIHGPDKEYYDIQKQWVKLGIQQSKVEIAKLEKKINEFNLEYCDIEDQLKMIEQYNDLKNHPYFIWDYYDI